MKMITSVDSSYIILVGGLFWFFFNAPEVILEGVFGAGLDKLHTDAHGSEELFLIITKRMHSLTQKRNNSCSAVLT